VDGQEVKWERMLGDNADFILKELGQWTYDILRRWWILSCCASFVKMLCNGYNWIVIFVYNTDQCNPTNGPNLHSHNQLSDT
jgi:hypothetical protein